MKGSVHRSANGTWEYRFDIDADPLTGRRRTTGRRGFLREKDAAQAMRKAMSAQEQGRRVDPSRRRVEEYLLDWHRAVRPGLRPSTWSNYRVYLNAYVLPVIGDTRLSDLTPMRLNLLYEHLLTAGRVKGPGGLSAKTVQNVHRMLHRALRDAVKWDYLPRNVADDAQAPRPRRPQLEVWTPEQLQRFVSWVEDDRFYALWLLVATTGLRRGELAGLRREDVDLVHSRISPTTTRVVVDGRATESDPKTTNGYRSIALDPVTSTALAGYITMWEEERRMLGQAGRLLFVWPHGQPIHPDTITALFQQHVSAAGLPRIRLHDVRHSYATAALLAGVPAKVVSERLGHATAAFTLQVYTHVLPRMDETAANTVAQLILGSQNFDEAPVRTSVRTEPVSPLESELTWAEAQVSDGSGGGI